MPFWVSLRIIACERGGDNRVTRAKVSSGRLSMLQPHELPSTRGLDPFASCAGVGTAEVVAGGSDGLTAALVYAILDVV